MSYIQSTEKFDTETHRFVTTEHALRGARRLTSEGLYVPAFVALHHHDRSLPYDYHTYSDESALKFGITHTVMVLDVLDALLDKRRAYIRKREGRQLTSQDIYEFVMHRRGPFNPTVKGREINVPLILAWGLNAELSLN
jgi:hypothetical protein